MSKKKSPAELARERAKKDKKKEEEKKEESREDKVTSDFEKLEKLIKEKAEETKSKEDILKSTEKKKEKLESDEEIKEKAIELVENEEVDSLSNLFITLQAKASARKSKDNLRKLLPDEIIKKARAQPPSRIPSHRSEEERNWKERKRKRETGKQEKEEVPDSEKRVQGGTRLMKKKGLSKKDLKQRGLREGETLEAAERYMEYVAPTIGLSKAKEILVEQRGFSSSKIENIAKDIEKKESRETNK